jgi:hypothetical protein
MVYIVSTLMRKAFEMAAAGGAGAAAIAAGNDAAWKQLRCRAVGVPWSPI